MKTHKTKVKLAVWADIKNGKPEFSDMDKQRVRWFCEKKENEDIRVEFSVNQKTKSAEFLGFYWGGLLPAYMAHRKFNTSQNELDLNPMLLSELCRSKKITSAELEDTHRMFLYEYCPRMVFDLKGKPHKEGGKMSEMGSREAIMFTTEVESYFLDNGIPIPNTEVYKLVRDNCELIRQRKSLIN